MGRELGRRLLQGGIDPAVEHRSRRVRCRPAEGGSGIRGWDGRFVRWPLQGGRATGQAPELPSALAAGFGYEFDKEGGVEGVDQRVIRERFWRGEKGADEAGAEKDTRVRNTRV